MTLPSALRPDRPARSPSTRWHRPAALLACVLSSVAASGLATAAESPDELREERRAVQEQAAAAAGDVDALTEEADELVGALNALRASADAEQAALDGAERSLEAAQTAEAAAEDRIADLEDEAARTEDLLRRAAIDAFTGFQGPTSDMSVLTGNPWQQARTDSLVTFGTGNTGDLIDELRAIGAELEAEREAAAELTTQLDAERAEVAERASALEAALAREEETLSAVESRLDARLAEAQALQSLDAELADEIQAREQEIAEAIAAQARSRPTGNPNVSVPSNAPVELATVRGIVVNVAMAQNLEGFLAAMDGRGFSLGGSGYRSSDGQIAVRRSNCGSSDYAIWEMPSHQCSPPTARPGQSAHEQGLAVDFTYQGSIIQSRGSAVFQAMSEVAPQYGLYNLPSEPWHWSTTGN